MRTNKYLEYLKYNLNIMQSEQKIPALYYFILQSDR